MTFSSVFFDLDATLYPATSGLWPEIRKRIEKYLGEVMKIPESEIADLANYYYQTYGTTLRGLQIHYGIDARSYLNFVHDLPIEEYLKPDKALRAMLNDLTLPRWIFTNSDRRHSERVLGALGIENCFDGIIAIEELEFDCKPNPSAFRTALQLAGQTQPAKVIFLDDSLRNLKTAMEMGLYSILVGDENSNGISHQTISRPHELQLILPEIFRRQAL